LIFALESLRGIILQEVKMKKFKKEERESWKDEKAGRLKGPFLQCPHAEVLTGDQLNELIIDGSFVSGYINVSDKDMAFCFCVVCAKVAEECGIMIGGKIYKIFDIVSQ